MVVEDGSVEMVVRVVRMRQHELESVVRVVAVVVGVEASVGVCGKNWTARRGQMSVVGHDSMRVAACRTACARSALEDWSDRGPALAYVCRR